MNGSLQRGRRGRGPGVAEGTGFKAEPRVLQKILTREWLVAGRDADLVTLMSRQDLARAMNEAVQAGESMAQGHGPRLGQQVLPPVQVQVVECDAVRTCP